MAKKLFQNHKAALAFAGVTIFSTLMLVGTEEEGGTLHDAIDGLDQQRSEIRDQARGFSRSDEDQPGAGSPTVIPDYTVEFADDEELIDDAQGFDPNANFAPPVQEPSDFDEFIQIDPDDDPVIIDL
ncbi:MAG: hypothetical protein ABJP48_06320 [Erythrobacter sp.]